MAKRDALAMTEAEALAAIKRACPWAKAVETQDTGHVSRATGARYGIRCYSRRSKPQWKPEWKPRPGAVYGIAGFSDKSWRDALDNALAAVAFLRRPTKRGAR